MTSLPLSAASAELQLPLATIAIGGIVSATVLAQVLLSTRYERFDRDLVPTNLLLPQKKE